jgi:phosphonate transport system ATP-binding protein
MLEVRDLQVIYPNGNEALKSISFSAQQGEIIAIIGRSGAGKSTLLRCINGIQKPSTGRIVLDGIDLTAKSEYEMQQMRRQIGFVWQEYNLVERLTAFKNVLSGRLGYNQRFSSLIGYFSKSDREIALRSLERVNMLHRANFRADRLSGGEKQRVSIARAISQQPKIILADEPVASLDPELSVQVMADLSRVAREDGVVTLINIHDVDLAKQFCDRLIGIAQGNVVFDGAPAALDTATMDNIYRFDKEITAPTHEDIPGIAALQQPLPA